MGETARISPPPRPPPRALQLNRDMKFQLGPALALPLGLGPLCQFYFHPCCNAAGAMRTCLIEVGEAEYILHLRAKDLPGGKGAMAQREMGWVWETRCRLNEG